MWKERPKILVQSNQKAGITRKTGNTTAFRSLILINRMVLDVFCLYRHWISCHKLFVITRFNEVASVDRIPLSSISFYGLSMFNNSSLLPCFVEETEWFLGNLFQKTWFKTSVRNATSVTCTHMRILRDSFWLRYCTFNFSPELEMYNFRKLGL